jgi:transposase
MGSPSIGTHSGTGVSPLLNRTGCRVWRIVPPTGCSHVTIVSLCTTCSSTRPRRARRRDRDLGLLERCEDLLDGPLLELLDQNRTGDRRVVAHKQARRGVEALVVGHLGMPEHLDGILAASPELAAVTASVRDFVAIMNERCGRKRLEPRITAALASGGPALRSFVTALRADQDAVIAGLSLPWSSGAVVA